MDKCPKMESEARALSSDYIRNATYSLTDENGFFTDLGDTWAIEKE